MVQSVKRICGFENELRYTLKRTALFNYWYHQLLGSPLQFPRKARSVYLHWGAEKSKNMPEQESATGINKQFNFIIHETDKCLHQFNIL